MDYWSDDMIVSKLLMKVGCHKFSVHFGSNDVRSSTSTLVHMIVLKKLCWAFLIFTAILNNS